MGFMFDLFPIIFLLFFGMFAYVFISTVVRQAKQERKNDNSPRLTVDATVVAKRGNTTRHHHGTGTHHYHTYNNTYYATFQFESGDRLELQLTGPEFGLIIEGDRGKLTFQGTRFLSFDRE